MELAKKGNIEKVLDWWFSGYRFYIKKSIATFIYRNYPCCLFALYYHNMLEYYYIMEDKYGFRELVIKI